jgi:hypothetical protein
MNATRRRSAGAIITASIALLVLGLALAPGAAAQDEAVEDGTGDHVVLTGGLVVPEGETVETAVVFDGPVVVDGTISETLVVFNGRTTISGRVVEDVVVFNGAVVVRAGAEIGGDLITRQEPDVEEGATVRGSTKDVTTRFDFEGFGFAARIAGWIGYSVSTLVLGLVLLLFAPRFDGAVIETVRRRTGAAIGFGVAVFFLVPVAAVVLLVTIVAIPLGVFALLALGLLYTFGYVVGAHAIGRLLLRAPTSRFLAFLLGWAIVRLVAVVPWLGGLAWLVVSILGLGIAFVAARRGPQLAEPAAIPPPPTPVPA